MIGEPHSELEIFSDNAVCVSLEKYKPFNAREKRLLAYLSQFNLEVGYIPRRLNRIADALSRLPEDINSSELYDYEPSEHLKNKEFILAINEQTTDVKTNTPQDDCQSETDGWTAYRIIYEPTEKRQEKTQELNPNAAAFIQTHQEVQNDVGEPAVVNPVTPRATEGSHDAQNVQLDPAQVRRSARIATRRARILQQPIDDEGSPDVSDQDVSAQQAVSDMTGDTAGTSPDAQDVQHGSEQEQTNYGDDADDFTQWAQDLQSIPTEMDLETLTDEIANIVNTPEITEADYVADPYFAPIYLYLKNDNLPIDNATARKILLMSENYYIEGHLLYKVSLPEVRKNSEQAHKITFYVSPKITLQLC